MCCFLPHVFLFHPLWYVAFSVDLVLAPGLAQVDELTADLHARSAVPKHVEDMIRAFPKDMHAMSMFGAALFAMQVWRAWWWDLELE